MQEEQSTDIHQVIRRQSEKSVTVCQTIFITSLKMEQVYKVHNKQRHQLAVLLGRGAMQVLKHER